jgi:hypothetical protein
MRKFFPQYRASLRFLGLSLEKTPLAPSGFRCIGGEASAREYKFRPFKFVQMVQAFLAFCFWPSADFGGQCTLIASNFLAVLGLCL